MADCPLLNHTEQTHEQNPQNLEEERLDKSIRRLELFLCLLGFKQTSVLSFFLSWVVFLVIGVSIPVVLLEIFNCSDCESFQIKGFELDVVVSQAILTAVSLFCVSHNLSKHGIRKLLFIDRLNSSETARFRDDYNQKISDSIRLLTLWILPCAILKTAREVALVSYVHDSWWLSVISSSVLIISWTYVIMIYLSSCILFHLVCNLQITHFDDYGKRMPRESDILILLEEHILLRHHLSKISHRFRIYFLLVFVLVTASQFVTLLQTTGYTGTITIINSGDFAISSIVQVAGLVICLNAAAKISHRAQGIAALATRWHATATCSSDDVSQLRISDNIRNLRSSSMGSSGSDLELLGLDFIEWPVNNQSSCTPAHHKRQAFVMYLQTNPGGITLYGWKVDRELINTFFFIELTLILFVLGETVVLASGGPI
ncbi:hypothetical protein NMG60_11030888 [Bertholletia excelsa]